MAPLPLIFRVLLPPVSVNPGAEALSQVEMSSPALLLIVHAP